MKNRSKILSLCLFFGLFACDLDEYPKDEVSPDTFFDTPQKLQLYTSQFYTLMPDAEDLFKEPSDLSILGSSLSDLIIGTTRTVPASGGGWSWDMLRHINYYLQNSDRCKDETARKKYDGLAYFWRGYFYFQKLRRFGDVPWYDQPLNSDDEELLAKPRDSRDVIMKHIIEDLDKAASMLPETSSMYEVNRYTALAFKSRACLFEGTFRKYHANTIFNPDNLPYDDLLEQAYKAAQQVMNNSKYELYKKGSEPYRDLFTSEVINDKEVLFARCYNGNIKHFAPAFALVASKGRGGYTKALVFSYLMKDGTRFTDKADYKTQTISEETVDRDPRLAQTVLTSSVTYADDTKATFNFTNTATGYPILKYVTGPEYSAGSTTDMPLIRLSEVYLNYAEAKAELGVLTQEDLDLSVNKIRMRVNMPSLMMADANATPDPFLQSEPFGYTHVDKGANCGVILEIRRERAIELVQEGFRYSDLMRWREGHLLTEPFYGPYIPGPGKYDMDGNGVIDFVAYSTKKIIASGVTPMKIGKDIFLSEDDYGYILAHHDTERIFDENRDYLFPVPINERVLTKGVLKQNPGWEDGLSY